MSDTELTQYEIETREFRERKIRDSDYWLIGDIDVHLIYDRINLNEHIVEYYETLCVINRELTDEIINIVRDTEPDYYVVRSELITLLPKYGYEYAYYEGNSWYKEDLRNKERMRNLPLDDGDSVNPD